MRLLAIAAAVALAESASRGLALDPDPLDPAGRTGRYYRRIDLRGWSPPGVLAYEARSSGDDLDCGSSLSWRTQVLFLRGPTGTEAFRIAAEGHQDFETRPIEGPLQAARIKAGCSAEDPAVTEYDAAGPADEGAARLSKAGALTPVCRVDGAHGKCASPDGMTALVIDRTASKNDARGCRTERLRYVLRRAKGGEAQLLAFSASTCARNDLSFQVSWSPDSRKVAAATNGEARGRSATAIGVFGRLDVFEEPVTSAPR
ncbi:MAG TPA: hypothetical protein VKB92_12885 [Myxococcales bacterium]|nr:hypothetical protein [Myxococcales bacterium]